MSAVKINPLGTVKLKVVTNLIKGPQGNPGTNGTTVDQAGNTAGRPSNPILGQRYFDAQINKPIWWDSAKWCDAMGNPV